MDKKRLIGQKIRQERERRGLTREQFCGMETELTVRQLMRIEQGKSLPTLVKLEYIAATLGLQVTDILGENNIQIPESYFEKKYLLFKSSSYGDAERISEKNQLIAEIYQAYFDLLPEEELLTLDLIERLLDWQVEPRGDMADLLFADYLSQVLIKDVYSLNDLLLIKYYALQCQGNVKPPHNLKVCLDKVLKQAIQGHEFYNVGLLGALSTIAGAYLASQDYDWMLIAVDRMDDIIQQTLQQVYRPVTLVFRAKYYVYHLKDKTKAKQIYDMATLLAQDIGDQVFLTNLAQEIAKDLATD
ncbi:helix-turn-helix domain-containing protein [Streptococcus cuniculipharyngis]|uniref:Helix-turn-helix transcriptional regulator n=1 Tax=Streptococcus cuniculipharyngis TaxID=1562651 RepID=A0A5C5SCX7_9STRE|nr:XRE family transcriptional regulator [Streptococcus cuniculipharyngis]TWS97634.1 helix-turn-helix transcriptional regulator [Streptococcus cuniculipharyngis]